MEVEDTNLLTCEIKIAMASKLKKQSYITAIYHSLTRSSQILQNHWSPTVKLVKNCPFRS